MAHNTDRRYGENVYMCSGFEPTGQQVSQSWYDEIKQYNFKKSEFSGATGHFTALVWCSSLRLGVGRGRAANGAVFVVTNYDPPGNMKGDFKTNVLPLNSKPPVPYPTALPASTTAGPIPMPEFGQQCLQAHNDLRKRHAAAALTLDDTISKHAQQWAEVYANK